MKVDVRDSEGTTELLRGAAAGDVEARERVWTRLYDEVLVVAPVHDREAARMWLNVALRDAPTTSGGCVGREATPT